MAMQHSSQAHNVWQENPIAKRGKKVMALSAINRPDTGRKELLEKYKDKLAVNQNLNRAMVSFQSSKSASFYHWLKYKEAFSPAFVDYALSLFYPGQQQLTLLDPFCGTGTALTTASRHGWDSIGVELLPVGIAALRARITASQADPQALEYWLNQLEDYAATNGQRVSCYRFPHFELTEGAFPESTENDIGLYVDFLHTIDDESVRYLFWFACLTILEDVSYTRKDGQYLRWDCRAPRRVNSRFTKGDLPPFWPLILKKLTTMYQEIQNYDSVDLSEYIRIIEGSCLKKLRELPENHIDLVVTSPPYCNRYDYTRTYALELAFMGYTSSDIKTFRQELLSATVENRSKFDKLREYYESIGAGSFFNRCCNIFDNQEALHEVLGILNQARERKELNNGNIPRMVEYYFFEMNLVVSELARVLAPGGRVVMVNDNVRYHGEEVPVDLILSDFAEKAGLEVDVIWVLPRGKGNSSQQMGKYGRQELRKCVYVWRKPH